MSRACSAWETDGFRGTQEQLLVPMGKVPRGQSQAPGGGRTKGTEHTTKQERFRLYIRKTFFTMKTVKEKSVLSREVVKVSVTESFQYLTEY